MKNFKRFHHGKPLRNLRDGDKKRLKYWVHQPRNKTKTRHKILTSNIIWLNRQAGKVKRILRSDWLPERARWAQPACSGFPAFVPQEKILLLTKLVRSRWLDIGLVLFCVVIDLEFVSVHKNAKKKLVNNTCILTIPTNSQIVGRKIFMANFYCDFRFQINKLIILFRML